jgi:hypothetical protein
LQIAGSQCHACGTKITFDDDGAECMPCGVVIHNRCLVLARTCPLCRQEFAATAAEAARNEDLERRRLLRQGLSVLSVMRVYYICLIVASAYFAITAKGSSIAAVASGTAGLMGAHVMLRLRIMTRSSLMWWNVLIGVVPALQAEKLTESGFPGAVWMGAILCIGQAAIVVLLIRSPGLDSYFHSLEQRS